MMGGIQRIAGAKKKKTYRLTRGGHCSLLMTEIALLSASFGFWKLAVVGISSFSLRVRRTDESAGLALSRPFDETESSEKDFRFVSFKAATQTPPQHLHQKGLFEKSIWKDCK
jgi:hypothetical protein